MLSTIDKGILKGGGRNSGGHGPQWRNGYKFLLCYTGRQVIYNMYCLISVSNE